MLNIQNNIIQTGAIGQFYSNIKAVNQYLCSILLYNLLKMNNPIAGFSKLSKEQKINWIAKEYFSSPNDAIELIKNYWNSDEKLQKLHDEFIENTITNFYIPLGVAPNFLINGKYSTIPMAIEESSVVAAASKSAKFWSERGALKLQLSILKK